MIKYAYAIRARGGAAAKASFGSPKTRVDAMGFRGVNVTSPEICLNTRRAVTVRHAGVSATVKLSRLSDLWHENRGRL